MSSHAMDRLSQVLLLAMVGAAVAAYPAAPDQVPVHWTGGVADRYAPKAIGLFLLPLMAIVLHGLTYLPENRRETSWAGIRLLSASVQAAVFTVVVAAALGYAHAPATVGVLVGLMCIVIGLTAPRVPQNGLVGVRTPWTLASEFVWHRTHILARPVMCVAGVIVVATAILRPDLLVPVTVTVLIASAAMLTAASFTFARIAPRKRP